MLDKDNKVQQRRVTTGPLQEDGLRVIEPSDQPGEGLEKGDWVVVGAILQVRPRMTVQPERVAMPTLGPAAVATVLPAAANPLPSSRARPTSR